MEAVREFTLGAVPMWNSVVISIREFPGADTGIPHRFEPEVRKRWIRKPFSIRNAINERIQHG